MAEIDAHMRQLRALKKELARTFASLSCSLGRPVSTAEATAPKSGDNGRSAAAVRTLRGKR